MDTTDAQISFDKEGICNHCRDFDHYKQLDLAKEQKAKVLTSLTEKIKREQKGKDYDCIIGLSGGVDSTYLAYVVVKQMGLNPLAVHLDNGWDSKLAVKNIENIVRRLDIDLHTHVIDWEEFKDIQIAYLKASVIDIEAITDHAVFAILYDVAYAHSLKHIILGVNTATERIMPKTWTFSKNDLTNLKDIHQRYGKLPLKTFPTLGLSRQRFYNRRGIIMFTLLDYIDYHKETAKKIIQEELKWVDYGGKHYESIFTRFYQGYILPVKFNVDKRKAHFSTLINSGQMTREKALEELKKPTYDPGQIKQDYDYIVKKFGFTGEEFDRVMKTPPVSHFKFKTDWWSKINRKIISPNNPIRKLLSPSKHSV